MSVWTLQKINGRLSRHCDTFIIIISSFCDRYQAAELKMTLSGLKAIVVKELPNVSDFISKNRINLIEERRRRMIITEFRQSVESVTEI